MKIAILDSGICSNHVYNCKSIQGISIMFQDNGYIVDTNYDDEIGHGTAIVDILLKSKYANEIDLFVVKIFKRDTPTTFEDFNFALSYIRDFVECQIILISSGVRTMGNYEEMTTLIQELYQQNIILVASYDNFGTMSYPASCQYVIGVEASDAFVKKEEFHYIESDLTSIIGTNSNFRVKWKIPSHNIVKGSSFTAAYFTGMISEYMVENPLNSGLDGVLSFLKQKATSHEVYQKKPFLSGKEFVKSIKKAIVFPFNKEVHPIAKFYNLLLFQVVGYYDIRQKGLIGSKIYEINPYIECEEVIQNYKDINWESDFDTVILGHTDLINKATGFDYIRDFMIKCKEYKKKLYSFDDIHLELDYSKGMFFSPYVDKSFVPVNRLGKLKISKTPVLGVYGTSSRQGKFTLQLMLRKLFLDAGYKVSQLSTEPNGFLFGCDEIYPMGYNSSVSINNYDAILALNEMMYRCELSDPDIIITGSQSSTVSYVNYNLKYFTLPQIEFIMGTQPDLVVICVNCYDKISYIRRTINFVESICECKVIGIVVYPKKNRISGNYLSDTVSKEDYLSFQLELEEYFKINVFNPNCEKELVSLFHRIISELL